MGVLLPPLPGQQATAKATIQHPGGQKVRIAPGSVNARVAGPAAGSRHVPVVAFGEATRGEAFLYTRDTTITTPHSLALVAGRLAVREPQPVGGTEGDMEGVEGEEEEAAMGLPTVVVDDWIAFELPLAAVLPLCTLRLRLAAAFAAKVRVSLGDANRSLGDANRARTSGWCLRSAVPSLKMAALWLSGTGRAKNSPEHTSTSGTRASVIMGFIR